jgi:hypothetical protein
VRSEIGLQLHKLAVVEVISRIPAPKDHSMRVRLNIQPAETSGQ